MQCRWSDRDTYKDHKMKLMIAFLDYLQVLIINRFILLSMNTEEESITSLLTLVEKGGGEGWDGGHGKEAVYRICRVSQLRF